MPPRHFINKPSVARGKTQPAPAQHGGSWFGKSPRRYRKVLKDSIDGITKNDVRRLARRGGVKRISAECYGETRLSLLNFVRRVMEKICLIVDLCKRKTVCISDVVFALHRMGHSIYGFGEFEMGQSNLYKRKKKGVAARASG